MPTNVIVIATDNPGRGRKVASALVFLNRRIILREVGEDAPTLKAGVERAVLVSDISLTAAPSIEGVRNQRRALESLLIEHVCLIEEDTPRKRTQANALRAGRVVCIDEGFEALKAAVAELLPKLHRHVSAPASVNAASECFHHLMLSAAAGRPIPQELANKGCELVIAATDEVGVREWLDLVWLFDDITHAHCLLVAGLGAAFASHLGFNVHDSRRLTRGALLHDVGKAKIPLSILNKPGMLSPQERAIIETHPVIGWDVLRKEGYDAETLMIARNHHEMLDGSGYPDGWKGNEIPDIVRMVTICDIFAALIERRSYKPPMTPSAAFAILKNMAEKNRLDPVLVKVFEPLTDGCEDGARAAG